MRQPNLLWNFTLAVSLITGLFLSSAFAGKTTLLGESDSRLNRKIENFSLNDFYGKSHALANYSDSKIVVLIFLGTECPLVKLYAPKLAKLYEEYKTRDVVFLGINSNRQDSITEIAAYSRRHKLPFPILKDTGNHVADALGAIRTPEVFVLDENRVVRYWGRVDDQYGVGFVRDKTKREDLKIALNQLLAGQIVQQPVTEAVGCHIGRIKQPNPNSPVTYSNQISRILKNRCVECHRKGQIAPFTLTSYDDVVGWASMIQEVTEQRRMPPWHANPEHGKFINDVRLSDTEMKLIKTWVANGAPEGDPKNLPQPKQYVEGWQLPREPDLVYHMNEEPFEVPAEGIVDYQYFFVDPEFTEDKWIWLVDALPGNPLVVHHAVLYFKEPEITPGANDGLLQLLVVYIPGSRLNPYPEGFAKKIPAGSKFVIEIHYTAVGSVQKDHTKIGLILADPAKVTHQVITSHALNRRFRIPPRNDNYKVEATSTGNSEDAILLAMQPHMHLRGKSFQYEAQYPNGQTEILLDVPRYDPNWQTSYRLKNMKLLPAGTRIHCVAHFDNSEHNVFNPDPTVAVRWGEQAWDEMMTGYFDIAIPVGKDNPFKNQANSLDDIIAASMNKRAAKIIKQFDKNGDSKVSSQELPIRFKNQFKNVDTNGDGTMSFDELRHALARDQLRQ